MQKVAWRRSESDHDQCRRLGGRSGPPGALADQSSPRNPTQHSADGSSRSFLERPRFSRGRARLVSPRCREGCQSKKELHKHNLSEVRADFWDWRWTTPGGASGAAPGELRAPGMGVQRRSKTSARTFESLGLCRFCSQPSRGLVLVFPHPASFLSPSSPLLFLLRRPWGAPICETVATFVGSWEVQRSGVLRTSERDLAVPGGAAICATVATFVSSWEVQRELLGGPAERRLTNIHARPRGFLGRCHLRNRRHFRELL